MAVNEPFNVAIIGHSFVRRMATYAHSCQSAKLGLDERFFNVTFIARGGLKVHQLYPLSHKIVHASGDVVFLEIGTHDLTTNGAVDVGDNVLAFANYLTVIGEDRKVVISHMYLWGASTSAYYVDGDFNNRVFHYCHFGFAHDGYCELFCCNCLSC